MQVIKMLYALPSLNIIYFNIKHIHMWWEVRTYAFMSMTEIHKLKQSWEYHVNK